MQIFILAEGLKIEFFENFYVSCETTQNFPSIVMEGNFCVPHIKFPLYGLGGGGGGNFVTAHIKFPLHGRSKISFCVTVYITIFASDIKMLID